MKAALLLLLAIVSATAAPLELKKGSRIVLVGNGLGSRMMQYGFFEYFLHLQHPEKELFIRNMCDEGNTPGFRPHSARSNPWAFPGAEKFHPPLSKATDRWRSGHTGNGSFPTPDEWLTKLKPDIIIGFFGYSRSFPDEGRVDQFEAELRAWINHTQAQKYNGQSAPQIALVSPITFKSRTAEPEGGTRPSRYAEIIYRVAKDYQIPFSHLTGMTSLMGGPYNAPITIDGNSLNENGYSAVGGKIYTDLFGRTKEWKKGPYKDVQAAVREKNWLWEKYYKIPNGVHVYGRRHNPFGPKNYPAELKKLEEMCANRDRAIWAASQGKTFDLAAADAKTTPLPEIKSNYRPSKKNGSTEYLYGDEALASFSLAPGYKIDFFASEREFPNLANPVQIAFDNKGRLWVSTMPTYPHWRPDSPKPNDKLLIYEDTDSDGKADKEIVFADHLHLPTGFEISHDGVYVAQGNHLIRLQDTDGDDKADVREIILSGFDDHDTHHVISAFCADPSGAIYMGEGTFLHSHIETAHGPVRSSNGGFFRYSPQRNHLERTARLSIPNPWGTAFDRFGQPFFLETSDPDLHWLTPGSVKVDYGQFCPKPPAILEKSQRVRPTSGLEFVSSRHFPDEVQGDVILGNTIGFLGLKQHQILDSESGYKAKHRYDLLTSKDGNFRPVDHEFAPDGSLYLCDWHNVLVGHMQHSARDPLRDHKHGRIYRITYPGRPLVKPAKIHDASLTELFENLTLPEARTRYRTRRELRDRNPKLVIPALQKWIDGLDPGNLEKHQHHLLEALWVSWGLDELNVGALSNLLTAPDPRIRAAAVEVLRSNRDQIEDASDMLKQFASDKSPRVRLQAAVAASWLLPEKGLPILAEIKKHPIDKWLKPVIETATAQLQGKVVDTETGEKMPEPTSPLKGEALTLFKRGHEVYSREGHCITCHQADGAGLPAAMFPPLAGTKWVNGSKDRLIKLTLHGLLGPIEVKGKNYPGQVPMTAFKQLSDKELSAVLTYVRNTFGNKASMITPAKVREIRETTKSQQSFYAPADLLKEHPHQKP